MPNDNEIKSTFNEERFYGVLWRDTKSNIHLDMVELSMNELQTILKYMKDKKIIDLIDEVFEVTKRH